jgi:hypothetical protein
MSLMRASYGCRGHFSQKELAKRTWIPNHRSRENVDFMGKIVRFWGLSHNFTQNVDFPRFSSEIIRFSRPLPKTSIFKRNRPISRIVPPLLVKRRFLFIFKQNRLIWAALAKSVNIPAKWSNLEDFPISPREMWIFVDFQAKSTNSAELARNSDFSEKIWQMQRITAKPAEIPDLAGAMACAKNP